MCYVVIVTGYDGEANDMVLNSKTCIDSSSYSIYITVVLDVKSVHTKAMGLLWGFDKRLG